MDPKWHIAFCNVTYTDYAKVSYRDYYGSPAVMLQAQLQAREHAERQWGVGRFITPAVESPAAAFATLFGMPVIEPADDGDDELPYLDTTRPPIRDVAEADKLRRGDPQHDGLWGRRYQFWQYYHAQGYPVGYGGAGGGIITEAMELTGNALLPGLIENPTGAWKVLERVMEAEEAIARFSASLAGAEYRGMTYTGDDFSGLLSPAIYREFALPCYQRLCGDNPVFMHSELLRAQHLRLAREGLNLVDFHGAGCKNLTLEEMREIMGERFWTQVTPQELLEWTPQQIAERVREYAQCGCWRVQLYPGRGTPERNMEAAIAACQQECAGGPAW